MNHYNHLDFKYNALWYEEFENEFLFKSKHAKLKTRKNAAIKVINIMDIALEIVSSKF